MKKKDHPILVGKTKETVAKLSGPGKPKPAMTGPAPAIEKTALKKLKKFESKVVGYPKKETNYGRAIGEALGKITASKKVNSIKPKGIAKPSSVSKPKPLPARLNTQKMMQKSIEGGKELKAAKRKSRRETAAMALGGLAATAGTILTDFRWKGNKKKL